jgi:hypothetical protein
VIRVSSFASFARLAEAERDLYAGCTPLVAPDYDSLDEEPDEFAPFEESLFALATAWGRLTFSLWASN